MKLTLGVFLIFTALLFSGCNFSLAADVTPPPGFQQQQVSAVPAVTTSGPIYPLVPPDASAGKSIYLEKCAPCHGTTGLGDGPRASDLPNPVTPIGSLDVAQNAVPSQWFKITTQGNLERFMPPFSSLTDRERWDVVAYMFSLSSIPIPLAQTKAVFLTNCAGCHGEDGQGKGPDARRFITA